MARPLLCAGVVVVIQVVLSAFSLDSPAHLRSKREWEWKKFFVYEETDPSEPPQQIGKISNTHANNTTEYILTGEGAYTFFKLNQHGDIFVLARLDREKKKTYRLKAQIKDIKTKREVENSTEFEIVVNDINDNSPVFSESYVNSVNERSEKGITVLTVLATDEDDPSTPNGKISYKLMNGTNLFDIDPKTGMIKTAVNTLDRETTSQYKLIVQASDLSGSGPGSNSATTIVTININDINDNKASFAKQTFRFDVKEDERPEFKIGILEVEDQDERQNKKPVFNMRKFSDLFHVERNEMHDGVLTLTKALDYEETKAYHFTVEVTEEGLVQPADISGLALHTTEVYITVLDVDEPPVFTYPVYNFSIDEGPTKQKEIGYVSAKDMDNTGYRIKYVIEDFDCPVEVNHETGRLTLKRELDREVQELHTFQISALEISPSGQKSYALVNVRVKDINDNRPELVGTNVYICESDKKGTVIGTIEARDKDYDSGILSFTLAQKSFNFSLHDNRNNTANIILTQGHFSTENSASNILEVKIRDSGSPWLESITPLHIPVCTCHADRQRDYCRPDAQTAVSASALVTILLCILTILVIVILFALRKSYQKEALVGLGKSSGEIHQQLVTYDEEGGGEMDTNGYDVSILSSACQDCSVGPASGPAMYAVVKKPSACTGDMAVMIEVKKDEADHDRDGIPYDTLHIYGYEGPESLAGSLSSLESSSCGSNLDYDVLSDWGPRFRMLAQLYGVEGSDSDSSY
ncbi:cadherin-5 [Electrophorus electricus]|uniref:Cadherin-5 n=1 Tax=Electrophorus electricus TaxID=8005 RepID=A0A4W4H0L7_ELEEL|nr:cadherin-5 [Electrophorus electricus]